MLTFIIPLQSRAASRDWKKISQLAERTLRSVCAQTDPGFRAVLVCNEKPETNFTHPSLTVIEENFPIPGATREDRMADKSRKILRGFVHARQWAPFHAMLVDADDCISNRLAAFVAHHPQHAGWYFETGYVHDQGSKWVLKKSAFNRVCGTSHILRCEPGDLPHATDTIESDYWILSQGHHEIVECMAKRGAPLGPLPLVGAVYNTATGENYLGSSLHNWYSRRTLLKKILNHRPLTRAIREEFGLYEIAT